MSEPALALLQGLPSDGKYVFGRFTTWYPSKDRLDKEILHRRGRSLPPWVLHDLRRSMVTHIAELGFAQPHVIEAIVNHVSGTKAGVAGVYNRATYLPEKREALEQWATYFDGPRQRSSFVTEMDAPMLYVWAGALIGLLLGYWVYRWLRATWYNSWLRARAAGWKIEPPTIGEGARDPKRPPQVKCGGSTS